MATSQYDEVQSFLSKLIYLSQLRFNANLNLSSFHGNLCLSLNVDLGMIHPTAAAFTNFKTSHCKPSRLRRRQRRRMRDRDSARNNVVSEVSETVEVTENNLEIDDLQKMPLEDANITEVESNITNNAVKENESFEADGSLNQLPSCNNENNVGISAEPTSTTDYLEGIYGPVDYEDQSSPPEPTIKDIYDRLQRMLATMESAKV